MSKKTQTAATVQASASTDGATVGQAGATTEQTSAQAGATTEQTSAQAGATTEQPLEHVRGRALIDLPAHGIKCGEFGDLPAAVARSLVAAGEFDPKAVEA